MAINFSDFKADFWEFLTDDFLKALRLTFWFIFSLVLCEPFLNYGLYPKASHAEITPHPYLDGYSIRLSPASKVLACSNNHSYCREVILLTGSVNKRMVEGLKSAVRETSIKEVCISSPGGSTFSAYEIGRYIHQNSLNTCMADNYYLSYRDFSGDDNIQKIDLSENSCYSSCPFILMSGGMRRYIGSKAPTIGLHKEGYRDIEFFGMNYSKREAFDIDMFESNFFRLMQETAKNKSDLRRKLAFVKLARATPYRALELYKMSHEEIKEYRLFTLTNN